MGGFEVRITSLRHKNEVSVCLGRFTSTPEVGVGVRRCRGGVDLPALTLECLNVDSVKLPFDYHKEQGIPGTPEIHHMSGRN